MLSSNGYGVKDKLLLIMTQEQKDLLIKDICARLPYGVKLNHVAEMGIAPETLIGIAKDMLTLQNSAGYSTDDIDLYKPFLFPLSSMSEEQKKEFDSIIYSDIELHSERYYDIIDIRDFENLEEFYNKNHIDYRGLIPMGLAIDATGLNIYELAINATELNTDELEIMAFPYNDSECESKLDLPW